MNEMEELLESDEPIDEVQALVWALVDDQATEADVARLEELLLHDDEARRTYVLCMQMHSDLHFLFGKKPTLPDFAKLAEQTKKAETPRQAATAKPTKSPLPLVDLPAFPSSLAGEFA
jgi:hypothetical protein